MAVSEVRRLTELERENAELMKMVAEQALDISMPKDVRSKKWQACRSGGAATGLRGDPNRPRDTPLPYPLGYTGIALTDERLSLYPGSMSGLGTVRSTYCC